jgi:hypothetical protein
MTDEKKALPPDAFRLLPGYTREWLRDMSREDIQAYTDLGVSYKRAKTVGGFFKSIITLTVGAFLTAIAFGETLKKSGDWFAKIVAFFGG